jgi:cytochrome c
MKSMLLASALISTYLSGVAYAAEPTAKDAIALVDKGAAFMKAHGKAELIKQVNAKNPDYVQGPLYMTIRDRQGIIVANPVNQTLIGKDLLDVPDPDGKLFRREILEVAKTKGKGWVDYRFKNPDTGKIESKTSYIMSVEDVTLESGIYKR